MQSIRNTLAENVRNGNFFARPENKFTLDDVPDLTGKVALVTGGSEGIGYGSTHTLLSKNISKLFVLSTSKEVVDGAVDAIREEMGDSAANRVEWMQCDLTDWIHTGKLAFDISKKTDRLDILINNAARGIMTQEMTPLGVDRHMALNHMGHVVLTSHLLPLLKKTATTGNTVRIVTLGSNIHENVPKDLKFESLKEINTDVGPMKLYGRSKLAMILYAKYLNRHLTSNYPNILANAVHPGVVETRQSTEHVFEPYPLGGYMMKYGLAPFKKDQFEGCISSMFAATMTDKSGQYICPPATIEPGSEMANDEELGERLMKLTRDLVYERTASENAAKGCPFTDY